MHSAKEEVMEILKGLPDNSTYEEIQYHLYVRQKIERGIKDIEGQNIHSGRDGKADGWMARKAVWAYVAEEDLDAAAAYIHRDSPAYAVSFHNSFFTGESLSERISGTGAYRAEFRDKTIREIFVYSYRLIYRIEGDRISILGSIHGRRDFQTAWDEKGR